MIKARRSMPAHLQRLENNTPGPGNYEYSSSIKVNKRDEGSTQECTWQVSRDGFSDHPKENPGPGTYDILNTHAIESMNRKSTAMAPGYTFPCGPKDATANQISKAIGPGPGAHDPVFPKSGTSKRMLGGSLS